MLRRNKNARSTGFGCRRGLQRDVVGGRAASKPRRKAHVGNVGFDCCRRTMTAAVRRVLRIKRMQRSAVVVVAADERLGDIRQHGTDAAVCRVADAPCITKAS